MNAKTCSSGSGTGVIDGAVVPFPDRTGRPATSSAGDAVMPSGADGGQRDEAAEIAKALGAARRNGIGWMCRCPSHDDHHPSLSIRHDDGRLLVHCFAGCSQDAVIAAIRDRGFWPERTSEPRKQIVATYSYRDEHGALRYEVVRYAPKDFAQRRPDGAGGWIWNMHGIEPLPYRLPELLAADPDAIVWLCEGEKDCDNLARLGEVASCNHGGAGKWKPGISPWFKDRNIVIVPDDDESGRKHGQDVARKLHGSAAAIKILPDLPAKDVSDWLAAGGTVESLCELAEAAPDWTADSESEPDGQPPRLPVIRLVDAELPRIVDEAEQALIGAAVDLYQRGGTIVRPISTLIPAADGRTTTSRRLGIANSTHIAETMTKVAAFLKFDGRKKEWRPVSCPLRIAETYLARMEWKLRPLAGLISAPSLRHDGSILDRPGYDERSALIFDPTSCRFPPVPERPTPAEAEAALAMFKELLCEFPFAEPIDLAVAVAAILTALVRRSLPSAPIFIITSPDFGYGKTLLADIVSSVATGDLCPVSSQGDSPEELPKHLAAVLLGGAGILCIDNVARPLGGDLLCQMLTQRAVRLRPLGLSVVVEASTAMAVLATGTNVRIQDDLVRRSLRCRLVANVERPELRQFQKRPLEMVTRDRSTFVLAGLSIMRSYITADRPNPGPVLGSFEAWCRLVRDALCWLGLPDITNTIAETRANDTKLNDLGALMQQWQPVVGTAAITVKALIAQAFEQEDDGGGTDRFRHPELRDALLAIAGEKGSINPNKLGIWLRQNAGKIVDGLRIVQAGELHHVQQWRCEVPT